MKNIIIDSESNYKLIMNFELFHILPDDKFTDSTVKFFNQIPVQNNYIVHEKKNYKYINPQKFKTINIYSVKDILWLRKQKFHTIIFHSLSIKNHIALLFIRNYKNIIWKVYGDDLYSLLKIKRKLYEHETYSFYIKQTTFLNSLYKKIHKRIYDFLFRINKRKINYISTVTPQEYELLKRNYKVNYINYFIPVHNLLRERKSISVKSNNILIGNSCNEWNNHLEIFKIVNKYKEYFIDIIVPLSYPKEKNQYRNKLISVGNSTFHSQFIPIKDFMPLDEYDKIFFNCKCAVFNHKRQAAGGNIVFAVSVGIKVFLDPINELYQYLNQLGAKVYRFPEDFNESNIIEPFSKEEVLINQNIIHENFYLSPEIKIERMSSFLNSL